MELGDEGEDGELKTLVEVLAELPQPTAEALKSERLPEPPFGLTPIQFVDVFPRTPDSEGRPLPGDLEQESKAGLYRYIPDPATSASRSH